MGEALKVYWWRLDYPRQGNFGDELTPVLIRDVFGRDCTWASPELCDLAGAGSIVEFLVETRGTNRPVIWGSGFMRDGDSVVSDRDFQICAVRGRLSKRRVAASERTVAVGDPGLLASLLLSRIPSKKYDIGILPHWADAGLPLVRQLSTERTVKVIDATSEPRKVIREVMECRSLLSSSLHGLIVADSLGVPNAHLRLSDNRLIGDRHKFRDYYSLFNDVDRHVVVEPGRIVGKNISIVARMIEDGFKEPADLEDTKKHLLDALPY